MLSILLSRNRVRSTSARLSAGVIAPLLVLALANPALGATIVNGGFETGNFAGWTVVNEASGSGDWFVYTGTSSPLSAFTIPAPPQGTYGAVTDQFGPGSHVLYQDVALEPAASHTLSFILYYENRNGAFFTPASLSYTVNPNQQYRVDIMKPSAPVFSVAPADVLASVFRTNVGDPASLAPTTMSVDLTPFAGTTVRVRFAEVDNQFFFQAGVDAVSIVSEFDCPPSLTPTITGTAGPDVIAAGPGNDIIFGLAGDDIICGGDGNDSISGGAGNDQLYGGNGADRISGDAGTDKVVGRAGNDQLAGGSGTDQLSGGVGDDKLADVDGAGGDVLDGGAHLVGDQCSGDLGDTLIACNP